MPYEIKPLVWKHYKTKDISDRWSAEGTRGGYEVTRLYDDEGNLCNRFQWSCCYAEYNDEDGGECKNFKEGKAKCEAHYRERVLECLVEVQP